MATMHSNSKVLLEHPFKEAQEQGVTDATHEALQRIKGFSSSAYEKGESLFHPFVAGPCWGNGSIQSECRKYEFYITFSVRTESVFYTLHKRTSGGLA